MTEKQIKNSYYTLQCSWKVDIVSLQLRLQENLLLGENVKISRQKHYFVIKTIVFFTAFQNFIFVCDNVVHTMIGIEMRKKINRREVFEALGASY